MDSNNVSIREAAGVKKDAQLYRQWARIQIVLRVVSVAGTMGATWTMLTSYQSASVFGIHVDARYTYSPAFKFFAFVNAVACVSTVASTFLQILIVFNRLPACSCQLPPAEAFFLFFLHDLVMMSVVVAGCGASTAIAYVGKHGNDHAGWMAICDYFGKFCNRVAASLGLGYLALLSFLLLTIVSTCKLRQLACSTASKS